METIQALLPDDKKGHQFVVYADSCSGIPNTLHAINLLNINNILKKLKPKPEFVCFPGDEISGLINDKEELLKQWNYWLNVEMKWLQQRKLPLYNTTGNHTTYNLMSENVFRDVFSHFPQNGPAGQKGLSYFIKKDNLLMIFVNTMWSGLGGEGRVETEWLDSILTQNKDVEYKLVFGHHPVFAVNGFSGDFQRNIEPENGIEFWEILRKHHVMAYFCSHILAFDVQVHAGILQILTAGAGTAYRMPEETEYLHLLQATIDSSGIRYQVLDHNGKIKEWLKWPLDIPELKYWISLSEEIERLEVETWERKDIQTFVVWEFSGISSDISQASPQTLISGWESKKYLPLIWIGLTGAEQRLTAYISPDAGRSPHHWYGPKILPKTRFNIQIAIHNGMGPGGLLYRCDDNNFWFSLKSSTPWGAEKLKWPKIWSVGNNYMNKNNNMCFNGSDLKVKYISRFVNFKDIMKSMQGTEEI